MSRKPGQLCGFHRSRHVSLVQRLPSQSRRVFDAPCGSGYHPRSRLMAESVRLCASVARRVVSAIRVALCWLLSGAGDSLSGCELPNGSGAPTSLYFPQPWQRSRFFAMRAPAAPTGPRATTPAAAPNSFDLVRRRVSRALLPQFQHRSSPVASIRTDLSMRRHYMAGGLSCDAGKSITVARPILVRRRSETPRSGLRRPR